MIKKLKTQIGPLGLLLLIVIAGFMARTYHLNFPSIGYHNMKENEVLSIAQEMRRTQDYLRSRVYFYRGLEDNPGELTSIKPALMPYQILLSWRLFGENLWAARLINVCFGVASIILIYWLTVLILGSAQAGLWAAFFLAVMPLSVFFSRNLQAESPAFFFMLLGSVFYVRFEDSLRKYNLFLAGLSFLIVWLYKANFLIAALPFLIYIPWLKLKRQRPDFGRILISAFWVYGAIAAYVFIMTGRIYEAGSVRGLSDIFSAAYWRENGRSIWWYTMGENYTFLFLLLAAFGMILAFLRTQQQRFNRYVFGWMMAAVIYAVLYSSQISQNSFFQMPFVVPLCVASAYAVCFLTEESSRYIKRFAVIPIAVIVLGFSLPQSYRHLERLYGTIFMGIDAAGETIKEFTQPQERVFLYTYAQGYGIARYAQRYVGSPQTLDDFIAQEKKHNIRILCFYPGDYFNMFRAQLPELYGYIEQNYVLKELGLMENPDRLGYVILEKGRPDKPLSEVLSQVAGRKQPSSIYDIAGNFHFFYTLRPVDEETLKEMEKRGSVQEIEVGEQGGERGL